MRDVSTLGRFDGVDRRSDTPLGTGFDSRALQPHGHSRCEVALDVLPSETCQAFGNIETHEAPQQCGASFDLMPWLCALSAESRL